MNKSVIQIKFSDINAGWKQHILLTSDRHHDNKLADTALEKRHLDMALERNAPIIDIGDLFCAMQGRNDRRRSRDELKAHLAEADNYFDLILDEAREFYSPYAHLFALIGTGNHETAVRRHSGIDLTYNIAKNLRYAGENLWPFAGNYGGYIKFVFDTGKRSSKFLKYYHGSGGGGPVTKGVIQTNRRAVIYPDADIIATGHIHEGWIVPITQERITQRGSVKQAIQWHVSTPGYKDEFRRGGGFHIERGGPPKPLGCAWLTMTYNSSSHNRGIRIKAELDIE